MPSPGLCTTSMSVLWLRGDRAAKGTGTILVEQFQGSYYFQPPMLMGTFKFVMAVYAKHLLHYKLFTKLAFLAHAEIFESFLMVVSI